MLNVSYSTGVFDATPPSKRLPRPTDDRQGIDAIVEGSPRWAKNGAVPVGSSCAATSREFCGFEMIDLNG